MFRMFIDPMIAYDARLYVSTWEDDALDMMVEGNSQPSGKDQVQV